MSFHLFIIDSVCHVKHLPVTSGYSCLLAPKSRVLESYWEVLLLFLLNTLIRVVCRCVCMCLCSPIFVESLSMCKLLEILICCFSVGNNLLLEVSESSTKIHQLIVMICLNIPDCRFFRSFVFDLSESSE